MGVFEERKCYQNDDEVLLTREDLENNGRNYSGAEGS